MRRKEKKTVKIGDFTQKTLEKNKWAIGYQTVLFIINDYNVITLV